MSSTSMTAGKTAAVGALLVALGPISMALYTPAMPTLVTVFGTSVGTVKLTLTVYFLGFALAQLVCGPLSDAYGRKPIVIAFTALYLIGSLLAVFAPTIEWLIAARAIQGIGAAAGIAISRAIVRDLFTGQESVGIMNMIGLMLAAGPALSPTIGGITLDLFGWHAIFLVMVAYGAILMAVFLAHVPETLVEPDRGGLRPGRLASSYLSLLRDVRFLRPTIVMACAVGSLYTLATILPFVLIDEVGMSPTAFGIGMLAQSGSFMVGSIVMRQLLKSVEAHRLVPLGLALIALGAFLLPILAAFAQPSFVTVMGPIGVLAFGIPFVMPTMMTESLAPFPRIAGAAAALGGFFQMGGGLLGSAIAAMMGDALLAMITIVPAMAAIAVVTQFAMKQGVSGIAQESEPERQLAGSRTPAE